MPAADAGPVCPSLQRHILPRRSDSRSWRPVHSLSELYLRPLLSLFLSAFNSQPGRSLYSTLRRSDAGSSTQLVSPIYRQPFTRRLAADRVAAVADLPRALSLILHHRLQLADALLCSPVVHVPSVHFAVISAEPDTCLGALTSFLALRNHFFLMSLFLSTFLIPFSSYPVEPGLL